jgi:probable rRNA maturation factor
MNSPIINLQNHTSYTDIPTIKDLSLWVEASLSHISKYGPSLNEHIEITFAIINEDEMIKLNSSFRNKQKSTNVLSFPDEDGDTLGDIIFCFKTIAAEADEYNMPINEHFAHLVIHGVLHLFGYDHITKEEALEMESIEINILAQIGIENPYE